MAIGKNSAVRVDNAKGVNAIYNGHLGMVKEIDRTGRKFIYKVKLNNDRVIYLINSEMMEL